MNKQQKKIIIIAVVAGVGLLLFMQMQKQQQQAYSGGMWGDIINSALNGITNATTSILKSANEEKRANLQQKYDQLRDTKDNSALFSNDILITTKL